MNTDILTTTRIPLPCEGGAALPYAENSKIDTQQ